jgi:hypothetical protein
MEAASGGGGTVAATATRHGPTIVTRKPAGFAHHDAGLAGRFAGAQT